MFTTTLKYMIVGSTSLGLMAGCATQNSAGVFSSSQAQTAQTVQIGTVVSVNQVQIQGENNRLVTAAAIVAGGLAGSTVSGRTVNSAIGATVGATAGGLGAQALQQRTRAGYEIAVQLDNGQTVSIVQAADVPITLGMRVRLLSGNGSDRVLPM